MEQNLNASSIVKEDITKASQFSKRFVMNDGTEREIHTLKPLHYFDKKTNRWEEIDNSFEETDDGYIAKFGNYRMKLSKEEQSERVEVFSEDMSKSISWRYIGTVIPKNPQEQSNHRKGTHVEKNKPGQLGIGKCGKLVYEGVNGDVDIEYDIANGSLKENIIVNQKKKDYKYYFELKLKGFDMRLSANGKSIEFVDCNSESYDHSELKPEFIMPEPIMFDADGKNSKELYYEVERNGEDGYVFAICASEEWINAEGRVFPVTIDPQISYVNTADDSIETYEFKTISHKYVYMDDGCDDCNCEHYKTENPPVANVEYNRNYKDFLEISIIPSKLTPKEHSNHRLLEAYLIFDVFSENSQQHISIENDLIDLPETTKTVTHNILGDLLNGNAFSLFVNAVESNNAVTISNIYIQ